MTSKAPAPDRWQVAPGRNPPPPDHTGAHSCCYFSLATKRRTGVQVVGMDRASREQLIET